MEESETDIEGYRRVAGGYVCESCDEFIGRDPGLHEMRYHSEEGTD
ncbi:hypothetical protein [Halovalidus salilacus]